MTTLDTRRAIVLSGFLMVVLTVPAIATAATPHITISDVTVSPSSPIPGEDVTVEMTIQSLQSSSSVYTIDGVRLFRGTTEYDRIENVGTVSPGSTVTIPLHASFSSTGTKNLKVQVWGNPVGENTQFPIRHPVSVTVTDAQPRVDLDINGSVVSEESDGTATIANGLDRPIQNVELAVDGDDQTISNGREVFASIDSGSSETMTFDVNPETAGEHELTATLTYMTSTGTRRNVTTTMTYRATPLHGNVVLRTNTKQTTDGTQISTAVRNRWNTAIENVTVRARAPNATIQTAYVDEISPGSTTTVALNATLQSTRTNATVTVSYDVGSRSEQETDHVVVSTMPTTVGLTGLNVEEEDGKLHITGSTSNLGTSDASSVLVSVVDTDSVDPAYPNREFFVGTVPASDFVTFDVYAETTGNVSAVPVQVSYLVDGERHQRITHVPVTASGQTQRLAATDTTSESVAGGDSVVVMAIGGVVSLAIMALMAYAWRNSRDSNQG